MKDTSGMMTPPKSRTTASPLDSGARQRLLEEIARIDSLKANVQPAPVPVDASSRRAKFARALSGPVNEAPTPPPASAAQASVAVVPEQPATMPVANEPIVADAGPAPVAEVGDSAPLVLETPVAVEPDEPAEAAALPEESTKGPKADPTPLVLNQPLREVERALPDSPPADTTAAPADSRLMPPVLARPQGGGAAPKLPRRRVTASPAPVVPLPAAPLADAWSALPEIPVDEARLDDHLIISAARRDPAHGAFDVLRTRLLQALRDNNWRRVAVTSPTKGCGKSFTALNLAIALSRYDGSRTVLLDLDLRQPALSGILGVSNPGAITEMLAGRMDPLAHLRRFGANRQHIGHNLALGLNGRREVYAAEILHEAATGHALATIQDRLNPDVVLFDLPPVLAQDDVIALRRQFDCVLMVAGGGMTTPRDMRESIRRIGEDKPIVGIVLNKAEGEGLRDYAY